MRCTLRPRGVQRKLRAKSESRHLTSFCRFHKNVSDNFMGCGHLGKGLKKKEKVLETIHFLVRGSLYSLTKQRTHLRRYSHILARLQDSAAAPFILHGWVWTCFYAALIFKTLSVFRKAMGFFKRLDILIVLFFANGIISNCQNLWGSLARQFKKTWFIISLSSTAMGENIFSYEECCINIFKLFILKKSIMI